MDAVRTLLHSTVVLNNDGTDDGSTYAGLAGLPAVYSLTPQLANGEDDVLSNAGQAAVHYWSVVSLTTGQSALAAGVHCPVVLTTRSTPNSIDDCGKSTLAHGGRHY